MTTVLFNILRQSLLITGFVFVMMLMVEYLNVLTGGVWQVVVRRQRWRQYVVAIVLGATPGCLGAFTVVAMYTHGVVSLGALVAAMIATSGDEAFVMFAMMPDRAFMLTGIMMLVGLVAGWATDRLPPKLRGSTYAPCDELAIHESDRCKCFPGTEVIHQWAHLSLPRAALSALLLTFLSGIVFGWIGPDAWDWMRVSVLATVLAAGFVVVTVPDHFLQVHLWEHVARKHTVRILLWTLGALCVTHLVTNYFDLSAAISRNPTAILLMASLAGIIPESGPHLVFVTLYAKGAIPMGILLANSIVQDGHGMLPLLGHSRKVFLIVKIINLVAGLLVGAAALAIVR